MVTSCFNIVMGRGDGIRDSVVTKSYLQYNVFSNLQSFYRPWYMYWNTKFVPEILVGGLATPHLLAVVTDVILWSIFVVLALDGRVRSLQRENVNV